MKLLQFLIHYGLHFGYPVFIARFFYTNWQKAYVFLLLTMLIDLDHLLADPLFDPNRCSIFFHALHGRVAIFFYVGLLFIKKLRIFGIGCLLHLLADSLDCLFQDLE